MSKDIDFNLECWYSASCPVKERSGCKPNICQRYLEMNYLIANCGMPNASQYIKPLKPSKIDYKTFVELDDIKTNIVTFVESGSNLFITSSKLKNGKTSWALKILYRYFHEIWLTNGFRIRGYFVYVPDFLMKLKNSTYKESEEYKEVETILKTADLVVWDDIAVNTLSTYEQMVLNSFLGMRSQQNKANIFTGFGTLKTLEATVGKMLAARISSGYTFEFLGDLIKQ